MKQRVETQFEWWTGNLRILQIESDIHHFVDVSHEYNNLHDCTLTADRLVDKYGQWLDISYFHFFKWA